VQLDRQYNMALVSGPGRGGVPAGIEPSQEKTFVVEKHVAYIKSLDTVRNLHLLDGNLIDGVVRGETS